MDIEKLKIVFYSAGWVEARLQEDVDNVEEAEEKKHRQEMLDAFLQVSNALTELRRENVDLQLRVQQAQASLSR